MTRRSDKCACGHARAIHAYHASGKAGVCWRDGCYCLEFEHEKLRSEAEPIARPTAARAIGTVGRASKHGPVPGSEKSNPVAPTVTGAAGPSLNEERRGTPHSAPGLAHTEVIA